MRFCLFFFKIASACNFHRVRTRCKLCPDGVKVASEYSKLQLIIANLLVILHTKDEAISWSGTTNRQITASKSPRNDVLWVCFFCYFIHIFIANIWQKKQLMLSFLRRQKSIFTTFFVLVKVAVYCHSERVYDEESHEANCHWEATWKQNAFWLKVTSVAVDVAISWLITKINKISQSFLSALISKWHFGRFSNCEK